MDTIVISLLGTSFLFLILLVLLFFLPGKKISLDKTCPKEDFYKIKSQVSEEIQ